jgi:pilus assembly protein CpaB
MRFGSILIFAVAFVLAGVAALLVKASLTAPAAQVPRAEENAPMPLKTILVAARDLKPGERLTPGVVREAAWPADLLPKGAFVSREALFAGGDEPVLYSGVAENEPILAQRLISGLEYGLAVRLKEGMRAITIRVNEASSVGGFVQPEDRVDVLMTASERPGEVSTGVTRAYTKTLVRNVRVLATDQQIQRRQLTQPPKTVTLEVSEEDAKRLTLAGSIGQLSLTLNRGEMASDSDRAVDLRDIAALPDEQKQEAVEAVPGAPVVTVFRSVERKEYKVPQE